MTSGVGFKKLLSSMAYLHNAVNQLQPVTDGCLSAERYEIFHLCSAEGRCIKRRLLLLLV